MLCFLLAINVTRSPTTVVLAARMSYKHYYIPVLGWPSLCCGEPQVRVLLVNSIHGSVVRVSMNNERRMVEPYNKHKTRLLISTLGGGCGRSRGTSLRSEERVTLLHKLAAGKWRKVIVYGFGKSFWAVEW